jgi:hypothetical protein
MSTITTFSTDFHLSTSRAVAPSPPLPTNSRKKKGKKGKREKKDKEKKKAYQST